MTIDLGRRDFLGVASVGATLFSAPAALAAPDEAFGIDAGAAFDWQKVTDLFAFPHGYIALNAANLCPTSRPVMAAQHNVANDVNRDPSFENRFKFDELKEAVRARLAAMVGGNADEIAITRNTSEGNCTIIAGLELSADDEVVLWDQNHESNMLSWQEASKRRGFRIVMVKTPASPTSQDELIAPFAAAMTASTRVVAFSHVSNLTGVRLPAEALCALARRHRALSLVDGAQTFAVMPIDLGAMRCDFYTASMHKWFAGPRECGLLYVRKDNIDALWPAVLGHGWDDKRKTSARKFDCLGQQEDGRIMAIGKAVEVYDAIGGKRIHSRIMELNAYLRAALANRVEDCEFITPAGSELSAGITVFRINHPHAEAVRQTLYNEHHVSALCIDGGEGKTLLRLCPHIYNSTAQLDHVVSALAIASTKPQTVIGTLGRESPSNLPAIHSTNVG